MDAKRVINEIQILEKLKYFDNLFIKINYYCKTVEEINIVLDKRDKLDSKTLSIL